MPDDKAVHGKLYRVSHYYNKRTGLMVERLHPICDTLENADYLIPEGTYKVERTWSPKFKKFLPELIDVPDRYGVRIHRGSLPEHSRGCILLDLAGMSNLDILFNQLEIYGIDEEVFIDVHADV